MARIESAFVAKNRNTLTLVIRPVEGVTLNIEEGEDLHIDFEAPDEQGLYTADQEYLGRHYDEICEIDLAEILPLLVNTLLESEND